MNRRPFRIRIPELKAMKGRGEKIAMLTAYDATMARLLDRAGIDVLLVGDSLGMVVMGADSTLPVTLDAMLHHTRAVVRGARRALVVADMPFLTYQVSVSEAVRNAGCLMQDGGAAAVKLEGGAPMLDTVRRLVEVGIPVMGHLGLVPQSVHQLGGFGPQATSEEDARRLLADAKALQQAGAFAVVLESIPAAVAAEVTRELSVPTIGIGAGAACDGQVLVSYDVFGLFDEFVPPFVKQYARLGETIVEAARAYAADVRQGAFPAPEHEVPPAPARKGVPR
jgi:3-methyl-2-oxobutanoate hydroxymethyltransferase